MVFWTPGKHLGKSNFQQKFSEKVAKNFTKLDFAGPWHIAQTQKNFPELTILFIGNRQKRILLKVPGS